MLDWISQDFLQFIPAKPFPGVDRSLGKLLMWAFLMIIFFTYAGIPIIDLFFPLNHSIALLLVLVVWVLFLLLFSAVMFWLVLKGVFF
jgi:hypothetical protein